MKFTLLDTQTGETRNVDSKWNAYYWAVGNGSCDCNRDRFFGVELPRTGYCLGGNRFLIIAADTNEFTLAELNDDYPDELLAKHHIGEVKPSTNSEL